MQVGVFAKTFPGSDPVTVMEASAAAGFDGVQYNMACSGLASMPDAISKDVTDAIAGASGQTGQQVFAVSGTYNMAHPDPVIRAEGLARLKVLAQSCSAMGTGLITLCTGTRDTEDQWRHHRDNGSAEAWRDMTGSFETAVAIAEAHGILLGVEPELANVVNSADAARRLIDELRSDSIRIVLDPANLFERAGADERQRLIEHAVDTLADRIVMAHAKDRHPDGSFATAGTGVVDFGHFISALCRAGFDGPLVTHGLAAHEAASVAAFLRRQLEMATP